MILKSRATATHNASRLPSTPQLILVVSTSFLPEAYAKQLIQPPDVTDISAAGHERHLLSRAINAITEPQTSNRLRIPASILTVRDNATTRHLLLTHGVEMDLSEPSNHRFTDDAILKHIFARQTKIETVDVELVLADASDTLHLVVDDIVCESDLDTTRLTAGVSREWKVQWLGTCETLDETVPVVSFLDLSEPEPEPVITEDKSPATPPAPTQEPELSTEADVAAESTTGIGAPGGAGSVGQGIVTNRLPKLLPLPGSETGGPADETTSDSLFISDDVPAGFEALAGPQTSFIDIYFNEKKVGATTITATAEDFTFDDPTTVVGMLDGVINPAELEVLLSSPLPTNGHRVCYGEDDPPGCGQVDPTPIAAIYNEADLSVTLFLAQELQRIQSLAGTRYLPPPEKKGTSIFSVYAVASDLEGEPEAFDVSGRSLLGYGNGNLLTEVDYNSRTERQRLREFKLTHFFRDHELQLGTYSFQPGGALTDINLLGASFSTSLKTRVDLEHAFSSELIVYLARRSVVQIAIDDRIYTGASYAAGNQQLDTRSLPDGSYVVEIRILDPISGARVERRSFTKSTLIPPRGEPQYNITVGVPLLFQENHIFPNPVDTNVVGMSMARRITDQSAYRLGLLQFGSRTFIQSEFLYLGSHVSLNFAASAGRDDTVAASVRTTYSNNDFSAALGYELFQSDFTPEADTVLDSLFPGDFTQISFSLSNAIKKGFAGFRSSYRTEVSDAGTQVSNQYALFYRRPIFRRKYLRGFLDTSLQQDELGKRINLQLRFFQNSKSWSNSLTTEVSRDDNGETSWFGGIDSNWQSNSAGPFEWGTGAYASRNDDDTSFGVHASLEHPWFASGFSTDWNRPQGSNSTRSSIATLSAHLGVDKSGAAFGGADFAQAGVIVSVKGEPAGARFDIVVNGIKTSSGEIGKSQFIGLQPFENYDVKLVPQTVLSNGIGESIYEFTLFPGTVQRIDIEAKRQVLLIATLINKFGELVENAVIEREPNPLLLEEGGFFQAEVSPGEIIVVKPANNPQCEFTVPDAGDDEVLVLEQPLLCVESTATQPAAG